MKSDIGDRSAGSHHTAHHDPQTVHKAAATRLSVLRARAQAWDAVRLLSTPDALGIGIPNMTPAIRSDLESIRLVLLQLAHRAAELADRDMRTLLLLEARGGTDGPRASATAVPPTAGAPARPELPSWRGRGRAPRNVLRRFRLR